MLRLQIRPEDWNEVSRLLDQALDLPAEARAQWLERLGARYESLKPGLRSLLSRSALVETSDFLNVLPDLAVAAPQRSDARALAQRLIGPYRLIRELGTGGMGTVWLAERADGLIARPVALKFPRGVWIREGFRERMARERQILATLDHPGIARLYDAGLTEAGDPYLVLEYVEGLALDRYCAERQLDVPGRLALFRQVVAAVAYAHSKLVIHRDLKPANVLVTPAGQVRLLDFGIGKLLDEQQPLETRLTELPGQALTPDYASPEQIAGRPLGVGTDIYSLGVILYELLTGERPYRLRRESRGALEDAILQADPRRPSQVVGDRASRKQLEGDLDAITLKALQKQPAARYPTADALLEDIERQRTHRPVVARPDAAWYRAGRFARRNRVAVATGGLVLTAVVAAAGIALWQARIAGAEQRRAQEVNAFIVSIFQQTDPYSSAAGGASGTELLSRARADLQGRFDDRPDIRIELLNVIASSLINLDDLAAAEDTLREAVAAASSSYGPDHPLTLQTRVLQAEILEVRHDSDALASELAQLLPAARGVAQTNPEILVRALRLRADLGFLTGRWRDIEPAAREALQIARRRLGADHPLTMDALAVHAESFLVGAYPAATMVDETKRAMEEAIAAHGGRRDHPRVLRLREIHGRALAVAGHFHAAVAERRALVDSFAQTFGASSPTVAYSMSNLAPDERRLGEIGDSLDHNERAMRIFDGYMPHRSAPYAFALTSRGVTLLTARRAQAALTDLAAAETTLRELFGPQHWDTVTASLNRAVALAYLGRFDDARAALAPGRKFSGNMARPWWIAHVNGIVERLAGDYEAAVAAQQEAERLIPQDARSEWELVRVLSELGLAELAAGERDQAQATLRRAQDLFVKLDIRMHAPYAEVVAALGATLVDAEPERALPLLEQAQRYWLESAPDNFAAGQTHYWLGRCYDALGRRTDATAHRELAERLLAKSPLPLDKRLLTTLRH